MNICLVFDPIPVDTYNATVPKTRLRSQHHLQQWDDESEEAYVPTEPYQRSMLLNMISTTQGYFYASFVNQSLNFTICDGNVTQVRESFDSFRGQFGNITNITNMTTALNDVADIMATSYPLTYSCYYGGTETSTIASGYVSTATTPQTMLYNLFAEMGPFYDTIYYLNDWRSQDKLDIQTNEEMKEYYYRLGAYGGILTAILFAGAESTDENGAEDTDGWVPVEEHSETTDDEQL